MYSRIHFEFADNLITITKQVVPNEKLITRLRMRRRSNVSEGFQSNFQLRFTSCLKGNYQPFIYNFICKENV